MIKKIADRFYSQPIPKLRCINAANIRNFFDRIFQNHRRIKGKNEERTKLREAITTITIQIFLFRWKKFISSWILALFPRVSAGSAIDQPSSTSLTHTYCYGIDN